MTVATATTQVTTFWSIVKGIALEAITVLTIVDPPAGIALGSAIAIADALITILPLLEAGSAELASAIEALTGHAQSVLIAAAPSIKAIPNQT